MQTAPKRRICFKKYTKYLVILVLLTFLQTSGLSTWIGRQMLSLSSLPYWAVTLLACILVSLVTEFVSNPATITIFLPILCSMVSKNNDIFSLLFPDRLLGMFQDVRVLALCLPSPGSQLDAFVSLGKIINPGNQKHILAPRNLFNTFQSENSC